MLGVGNMGSAILEGVVRRRGAEAEPVRTTTRSRASAERLGRIPGVRATSLEDDPGANRAAVEDAEIVLVGVKPHLVAPLLDEIASGLARGAVLVSYAAGITVAAIRTHVPESVRIVRAMPNTPASLGLGVTGIAGHDAGSLAAAHAIFAAVGEVFEVDEDGIDAIAALSGSGPAHVYFLIEAFIRSAERLGFGAAAARRLVVATFRGSVAMVEDAPETPVSELRRRVTSPHGTTERSVAVLESAGLDALIDRALAANIARSREIASESRASESR